MLLIFPAVSWGILLLIIQAINHPGKDGVFPLKQLARFKLMSTQSTSPESKTTLDDKRKFVGIMRQVSMVLTEGRRTEYDPDSIEGLLEAEANSEDYDDTTIIDGDGFTAKEVEDVARQILEAVRKKEGNLDSHNKRRTASELCEFVSAGLDKCFHTSHSCNLLDLRGDPSFPKVSSLSEAELDTAMQKIDTFFGQKQISNSLGKLNQSCNRTPTRPSEVKAETPSAKQQHLGRKVVGIVKEQNDEDAPPTFWNYFAFGCVLEVLAFAGTCVAMEPGAFVDFLRPSGDFVGLIQGASNPSVGDIIGNNLTTGTGIFATILVGMALLTLAANWAARRHYETYDPKDSTCNNIRAAFGCGSGQGSS